MNISRYNLQRFCNYRKEGVLLPSGDYTAILENSTHSILKNNSEMLKLIWKINAGEHNGDYFFSYFNMSNPDALNVLCKMIHNMGFIPEKIKNIDELYGSECRLIVKLFNHKIHGQTNIVERYFPVRKNTPFKKKSCNPFGSAQFHLNRAGAL